MAIQAALSANIAKWKAEEAKKEALRLGKEKAKWLVEPSPKRAKDAEGNAQAPPAQSSGETQIDSQACMSAGDIAEAAAANEAAEELRQRAILVEE